MKCDALCKALSKGLASVNLSEKRIIPRPEGGDRFRLHPSVENDAALHLQALAQLSDGNSSATLPCRF